MLSKFKFLFNETYGVNIYWIQCPYTQFLKRYRCEFGEEFSGDGERGGWFTIGSKNKFDIPVIWVPVKTNAGCMVHEIFHAACWILNDLGITVDSKSGEEAHAYLIQWMSNKILPRLKIKG